MEHEADLLKRYLAVLQREERSSTARAALDPSDEFTIWFMEKAAHRLKLLCWQS